MTNSGMIWKCGDCFPAVFPNFSQHKMQHHPPATVTAAQHISGASLNFPRWCSTNAKLFTAVSVTRCSGPSRRSKASRPRRRSGSASAKAPRASSTSASLGGGSPREPKYSHGIFLDPHLWWENKNPCFKLFWFHLSSCHRLYFIDAIFDACCKYCCNLQLSLCGFVACQDANLWWQDNTVLDSTIHVC